MYTRKAFEPSTEHEQMLEIRVVCVISCGDRSVWCMSITLQMWRENGI